MDSIMNSEHSHPYLYALSDIAGAAQTKIQQDFTDINPVIGLNSGLRQNGFAADIITIDCLLSGKRVMLLLHDDKPEEVAYQFGYKGKDPDSEFVFLAKDDVNQAQIYEWMKSHLAPPVIENT
jgi:hypothetical protein